MLRGVGAGLIAAALASVGLLGAADASGASASQHSQRPQDACKGTVYLTLDTGNMRDAELMAGILSRHGVRATFFLANEKTFRNDYSLDASWGPFWRQRVAEGHLFGSHTFDHVYFREARADVRATGAFLARPEFGAMAARDLVWRGDELCGELRRVDARFRELAGRGLDPLWRAPGGRAPGVVMEAAKDCGFRHVHWAEAGFLGDELPSDRFPNDRLLAQALARIRSGDILMAHLGIWSRKDPWAPMLDPLIEGLKRRGLCFETLDRHPDYRR